MGPQRPDTPPLPAPRAPNDVVQRLECVSGGTRIAITKPEIGIDYADQIELGKMVSLGNELRTDDEKKPPRCYVVELPPQTLDRFHKVAREHQNAGLRKQLRCLLLKPFDAWPDGCKAFGGMAIRAFRRWRDGIPTVVTHQPSLKPMIDQPSVAIRTLHTESAGTTQR